MYNVKRNFKIQDNDTIFEMMRLFQTTTGEFDPVVDQMTNNFDFTIAALQWDKEVKAKLESENRPHNSYNLIRTILNVIYSIEFQNRRKGTASPRTGGDNQLAQTITEVMYYYLYHAKFTAAQKTVFMNSIIARLGVYYVNFTFDEDPEGSLIVGSCDPREFRYERKFDDPLWSSASYVMRKHEMSLEEILNKFALNDSEMQEAILEEGRRFFDQSDNDKKDKWVSKKLKSLFSAVYETATGYSSSDGLFKNYLQWWNPANGKFDVLELHETRMERRLMLPDSKTNKKYDITDHTRKEDGFRFDNEKIDMIKQQYGFDGDPHVELENRRFVTAVVPTFNLKVNEQPYPFKSDFYVYIPQYCYNLHPDPLRSQSIIDDLRDPQAHFNKAKSLILELLGRYANKGWILDENAINGVEEDWEGNRIAPYKRVRAGYMGQIRPEEGQTISPDLIRDANEQEGLMRVITNVQDEARGQDGSEVKSGKHFLAKEQSQTKSFAYVLDNHDNSQKAVFALSLNFIQHFVKSHTILRITQDVPTPYELHVNKSEMYFNEQGQIAERIVNDLDATKYDIELSQEPYGTSAQEIKYNKLGQLFDATLAVNPKKADVMLPIIVEAGNFPEAQRILTAWDKVDQPSPEQQQQMQQMAQMQEMLAQIQMSLATLGVSEKQEDIKGKELDNLEKAQRIKHTAVEHILNPLGMLAGQGKSNSSNGNGKKASPIKQPMLN